MSHIAIIGATGRAGGRLLEEALRRGHTVTAIARHASAKLSDRANVKAVDLDVLDGAALEKALAGHDAVFSAAHFATVPPAAIIEPATRAGGSARPPHCRPRSRRWWRPARLSPGSV